MRYKPSIALSPSYVSVPAVSSSILRPALKNEKQREE
jgi:hypothetical protein